MRSKKWQEASLVYCMNQSKGITKAKLLSSSESVKVVLWFWYLWWEGFVEMVSFESRVKRTGIMDSDSGDDGRDEQDIKVKVCI